MSGVDIDENKLVDEYLAQSRKPIGHLMSGVDIDENRLVDEYWSKAKTPSVISTNKFRSFLWMSTWSKAESPRASHERRCIETHCWS
mmetsp:Transcript_8111/g.14938  ORF Transcript_8111/g.14938 Transcript_8111/m.14938 type:complete len:87 (-) Transcript_8111:5675-5935(-)